MLFRIPKRLNCPYCQEVVVQWTSPVDPNFCPRCHRLFRQENTKTGQLPPYTLGVLAVLAANILVYA